MVFRADNEKFRELIIFFAEESERDRSFGATKLNKLLFYADFVAYLRFGKPITGHRYQKLTNGPAPRALVPIVREMEENGDVTQVTRDYFGKSQKRLIAKREPDLRRFSGPEVQLMHEAIEEFRGTNASAISKQSHEFIGWQLAEMNENIPYEAALVGNKPLSAGAISHGLKLAKVAESCLAEYEEIQDRRKSPVSRRAK